MTTEDEITQRLKKSVKLLRAWHWMSALSTQPADAVAVLTAEARSLVQLGLQHPTRVREIGRLIVAYEHMIAKLKTIAPREGDPKHGDNPGKKDGQR